MASLGLEQNYWNDFFPQVDGFRVPPPAGCSLLCRPALPHLPGRRLPGEHLHLHHHPLPLFCHIGDHDDDDDNFSDHPHHPLPCLDDH